MIVVFTMIYSLLPILSTPLMLIGLYLDKKRYKYYLFAIVLNLAFIGYHFEPLYLDDLYRHFEYIDRFRSLGLIRSLTIDPLIVKNLWFYLISVTKINSLLPFSAIIITYYIILKDIISFSEKEKFNRNITISFVLIILIFLQLIWVMSGIRFAVSLALFFHGMYKEFILKKKGWAIYILYLISFFIHYSIIVLLFIRIIVYLKKKMSITAIVGMLIWGYFIEVIAIMLGRININYLQELSFKMQAYLIYTNESSYMKTTNFIKLLYCIITIISYLHLKKAKNSFYNKYKGLYDYCLLLSLFCIGGANIFIILDRFGFAVLTLLPLVLIPVFQYSKDKFFKQLYVLLFVPIGLIGLYLQYIPLKATNYDITSFSFMTRNIITMFMK